MKKFLKENERIIQWLSGLGFPIALVLSSWLVSSSIENAKVDSDYVKLAISILNSDADITNSGQKEAVTSEKEAMRGWAIRVLDEKSPVKLTEKEKQAFVKEGIDYQMYIVAQDQLRKIADAITAFEQLNKTKADKAEDEFK